MSYEHLTLLAILAMIGCIGLIRICFSIIMRNLKIMKAIKANNIEFKTRMKAKKEMQEKGGHHEWVRIPYGTKEILVCKKTGWSGEINGFLSMEYVNQWIQRQKLEEEYISYREEKMIALSEKYDINKERFEEIAEDIFSIKQNFHLKKMKQSVKEMKNVAKD